MNDEQYKRYRKMFSDSIECLYKMRDHGNYHFLILGSTKTKYKVSIYKNGDIKCGCPDFKHHKELVCKHCLYVIFNIIGGDFHIDHEFFKRNKFTRDEIQSIHLHLKNK